jgi:hypothetical protein
LVVPSDHGAHQHPESIDEIRRILLLHLEAKRPWAGGEGESHRPTTGEAARMPGSE